MWSWQIINRYGADESPYSTSPAMSKESMSPSSERTFTFVFLSSTIMAATVSLGDRRLEIFCSISPLCKESNALQKSINKCWLRFFTRTPSKIQQIVKICDVVDRFLRKPFCHIYIYICVCAYRLKYDNNVYICVLGENKMICSDAFSFLIFHFILTSFHKGW